MATGTDITAALNLQFVGGSSVASNAPAAAGPSGTVGSLVPSFAAILGSGSPATPVAKPAAEGSPSGQVPAQVPEAAAIAAAEAPPVVPAAVGWLPEAVPADAEGYPHAAVSELVSPSDSEPDAAVDEEELLAVPSAGQAESTAPPDATFTALIATLVFAAPMPLQLPLAAAPPTVVSHDGRGSPVGPGAAPLTGPAVPGAPMTRSGPADVPLLAHEEPTVPVGPQNAHEEDPVHAARHVQLRASMAQPLVASAGAPVAKSLPSAPIPGQIPSPAELPAAADPTIVGHAPVVDQVDPPSGIPVQSQLPESLPSQDRPSTPMAPAAVESGGMQSLRSPEVMAPARPRAPVLPPPAVDGIEESTVGQFGPAAQTAPSIASAHPAAVLLQRREHEVEVPASAASASESTTVPLPPVTGHPASHHPPSAGTEAPSVAWHPASSPDHQEPVVPGVVPQPAPSEEARLRQPDLAIQAQGAAVGSIDASTPLSAPQPQAAAPLAAGRTDAAQSPLPAANPVERMVVRQVSRALVRSTPTGDRSLVIRLTPPELGTVRIEFIERDGAVTARIHADDPAVRQALDRLLPQVRGELRAADSPVQQITVSAGSSSDQAFDGRGFDGRGTHQQPQRQESAGAGHRGRRGDRPVFSLDGGTAPIDAAAPSAPRPRISESIVDALA